MQQQYLHDDYDTIHIIQVYVHYAITVTHTYTAHAKLRCLLITTLIRKILKLYVIYL